MKYEEWLRDCDERRYDDPAGVLAELEENYLVPHHLIPRWMGVVGSCYRQLDDLRQAEGTLKLALSIEVAGCEAGALHQRLSQVFRSCGDYEKAMSHNSEAVALFVEEGDMAGLGRSLTDRGLTLYDIEKYRRATRVLRRAAHLLPASEKRNLAACYQGLSLCAIKEKRPLEALVHADKAGGFDLDLLHQGKLNWAVGIALFDAGEGNLAKTKFTRAMDFLAQVSPINAALCAIDFCEALLERGEAIAAHRTASAMSDLVGSLRNTREAQAALIELATIGLRGTGLTRALLSQNRARVSKAS